PRRPRVVFEVVSDRLARGGRTAAPVRLAHLGLGNFFRAHQAWYTGRARDHGEWGIAAFGGRGGGSLIGGLNAQDRLYTLVAGVARRGRAGAGALAVVSCDNVAGNGAIVQRVVRDAAELVAPELVDWMAESVSFPTTMVDRITPRTAPEDVRAVLAATGREDRCPVVAEPFKEWVLSGAFPAGRPRWEDAGAAFTADVTPFENRKLWLLNGAHSLLAYAGSIRRHATVAEAMADDACRAWLEEWWAEAARHLEQPDEAIAAYREA